MNTLLSYIISLYQKTLSPDHGIARFRYPYGYCRFYPSCSQYTREALQTHGITKGMYLAAKRVLSCNPWNDGGMQAVPKRHAILKYK